MNVSRSPLPTLVAVYEREVNASLERIWENVLDWEHLPWLHASSFSGIRLLDSSASGWRAQVSFPGAIATSGSTISVELDRPGCRYLTRTVDGPGAGGEILTALDPRGDRRTAIRVEFRLPVPPSVRATEVGQGYRTLYVRLWNEDEAMMIRRQRILDRDGALTPSHGNLPTGAVRLGREHEIRAALPCLVEIHARRYRIVEVGGHLLAHPVVCAHLGGPLEDAPIVDGRITCPWHGYRFDVRDGRSCDGRRLCLDPAPRLSIEAGEVFAQFRSPSS